MSTGRFAVILEGFEILDPEWLALVFQDALGLVAYDSVRLARDARGILAQDIAEQPADRLVRELHAANHPARKIAQETVVRIGKPNLVRSIRLQPQMLELDLGYTGATRSIPWDRVVAISAGEVVEVSTRTVRQLVRRTVRLKPFALTGGERVVLRGVRHVHPEAQIKIKRTIVSREAVELVDLFAREEDGGFLHVRLRARDLYYDRILGPDSSKNFQLDFRTVLYRLCSKATQAVVNPGMTPFLESLEHPDADMAEAQFAEEREFSLYNAWQLQLYCLEGIPPPPSESPGAPPSAEPSLQGSPAAQNAGRGSDPQPGSALPLGPGSCPISLAIPTPPFGGRSGTPIPAPPTLLPPAPASPVPPKIPPPPPPPGAPSKPPGKRFQFE